ncbi:MAG: VanW family protein, partial [Christensenellaceae bacterium]|nr:VanW family protein [Christensenellaceae bacterium]
MPQPMGGLQQPQQAATNMPAPQPMPQSMGSMQQPRQTSGMPAPQMMGGMQQPNGMQQMPPMMMNGQPMQPQQQPGYGWEGAGHPAYYGQPQQPYYGMQGYRNGMAPGGPETVPDDAQPISELIDQPAGKGFFGGFGGWPPRHIWQLAVIAAVVLVLIVGGVFGIRAAMREQKVRTYVSAYDAKFCEGVYVDGIHLGGMTQQEAISVVTTQAQQRNNDWYVRLTYQGKNVVEMNAATLGMRVDVIDVLREAWEQGHASSDVHERQEAMQQLLENPYRSYTAVPSGDTSIVDSVLEDLRSRVYRAPQDAVLIEFDPAKTNPFTIQEEVAGMMLNTDSLKEEIYRMVSTMESGELEIQPEPIAPNVTAAQLRETVALRADEYTEISTRSTKNRNENIKRAFELITGTVLKPGDTFSFNGIVGKRSIENGFFSAPEYQYGNEVEGIGGGVCQASTTLYLAAVAANLEITKHTPHSMQVNYTTYGKDATVNMDGKQIDFAFRNNTDSNIYICAAVQYDRSISKYSIARVRIYGPSLGAGVTYKLEAEELEVLPKPEDEIRKDTKGEYVVYTDEEYEYSSGREGHVTQSYKVKYVNGVEVERTKLYKDTYKAAPRIVYVGVEERWMY